MAVNPLDALFELPKSIEIEGLAKFDQLIAQGEIFYEEPTYKSFEDGDFRVQFLISPSTTKKPILSEAEQAPAQAKKRSPFIDPDPDFVLGPVGPEHTLIFNKYCTTRPMYLLHTNDYQPQRDGLTDADLKAIRSLFSASDQEKNMVIFNCGADAGASQGHKHFHMFPRPEMGVMFPDALTLSLDDVMSDTKVPYKNFSIGLEAGITVSPLKSKYEQLMTAMNTACKPKDRALDYNLILVKRWMAVIPRTHASLDGKGHTNSAGMMGWIWVKDDAEMEFWMNLGVAKHLTYLGVAA
ncbi:hypothetical protein BP5796_08818 [Coleophoma crateriformis]|uniref:Uncharacterized protein n=1 Tax=Coleophoma crateriformis TaxID=565419 RepID=A0A3D8R961_9HELO|nr:hypothetical protein BP5796_08818 [Coleophoma crateriformis]